MIDYEKVLDPDQYKVVTSAVNGNKVCIASAGTGKTYTLTHRIAYLIDKGVNPSQIMLLTFTNKAAKEMISRTSKILNEKDVSIFGGTFHSTALNLYYKYSSDTELKSLISPDDTVSIIELFRNDYLESCIHTKDKKNELKKLKKSCSNPKEIAKIISYFKNHEYLKMEYDTLKKYFYLNDESIQLVLKSSKFYEKYKAKNLLFDFDDLMYVFYDLLMDPSIGQCIRNKYKYIFVDEAQDINSLQFKIVKAFNNNIFLVGDAKQAIYEFRGSNSEYIIKANEFFAPCEIFYLKNNYRSSKEVINAANLYINEIRPEISKNQHLICTKNSDGFVYISNVQNENHQCSEIVDFIKKVKSEDKNATVGILLRINIHSRMIEQSLIYNNIPYTILCSLPFFSKKHIRDIVSFVKLVHNPKDKISFIRVSQLFDGIGPKAAERIYNNWQKNAFSGEIKYSVLDEFKKLKFADSAKLLTELFVDGQEHLNTPEEIVQKFYDEFYCDYLLENWKDDDSLDYRQEECLELVKIAQEQKTIKNFLNFIVLMESSRQQSEKNDIVITTVHKSKGLEYDYVIIPYSNYGIFPYQKSVDEGHEIDESNVYYVALTRAKYGLLILVPSYMRGYTGVASLNISEYVVPLLPKYKIK